MCVLVCVLQLYDEGCLIVRAHTITLPKNLLSSANDILPYSQGADTLSHSHWLKDTVAEPR